MKTYFHLRIRTEETNYQLLNKYFDNLVVVNSPYWEIILEEGINGTTFEGALTYFSNLLKSKKNQLKDLGVEQGDISLWYFYEYNQQCNIEFSKEEIRLISELGVIFCISCWEQGSDIYI
jgi:hypothetical protein